MIKCGGTALRLGKGKSEPGRATYEGKLELAKGTEPYVVRAFLVPNALGGKPSLDIIGDTGGEFRMFRRSFPFQTTLSRSGDPALQAGDDRLACRLTRARAQSHTGAPFFPDPGSLDPQEPLISPSSEARGTRRA